MGCHSSDGPSEPFVVVEVVRVVVEFDVAREVGVDQVDPFRVREGVGPFELDELAAGLDADGKVRCR